MNEKNKIMNEKSLKGDVFIITGLYWFMYLPNDGVKTTKVTKMIDHTSHHRQTIAASQLRYENNGIMQFVKPSAPHLPVENEINVSFQCPYYLIADTYLPTNGQASNG